MALPANVTDLAKLANRDLLAWCMRSLDEAVTIIELKQLKATSDAIAAYRKAFDRSKEGQQGAVEITLRCQRRLQQELLKLERNKGGRPRKTPTDVVGVSEEPPTLNELGLAQPHTHRGAVLAKVTPEQFEAGITALRESGDLTQEAMLNLMGDALAGGLDPEEIEDSVKAERSRRPKEPPAKLKIDLSPVATAIYALEGGAPWIFAPEACAATVDKVVRGRVLDRARFCRDWLDTFITTVEETDSAEVEEKPRTEAA